MQLSIYSGGSVAFRLRLRQRRIASPFWGALLKKACVRFAHIVLFISSPLQEQVLDGPENK